MGIPHQPGFRLLGGWTHDPESTFRLDAKAPREPCVYAFVVDDIMVYVGLTKRGLHTRFEQYRRGHVRQRTSARINKRIRHACERQSRQVADCDARASRVGRLPVNTARGAGGRVDPANRDAVV
jgi:hypothetical protein